MKFALSDLEGGYLISAYSEGAFTVGGRRFEGSLLVRNDQPPSSWAVTDMSQLNEQTISELNLKGINTLLLGTGNSLQFPEDQVFALLYKNAIGVEFMDTPAACRTYNILMSEGRSVAAALMAIR
jgi:uncharacterized protein